MDNENVKLAGPVNQLIAKIRKEELGLSREAACELLDLISVDRLEKIENGKTVIRPDEVLIMAEKYNHPELCRYYCKNECSIGDKYVHDVEMKDLAHIAVETLNSIVRIDRSRERFLEIVEDEKVDESEMEEFLNIKQTLDKIAATAQSLQIWVDKMMPADLK